MSQKKEKALKDLEWRFEGLYDLPFLQRSIIPLIVTYLAYYIYLYFAISGANSTTILLLKALLGGIAYLLSSFWLLRVNFSFWSARISPESDQPRRIFPFPAWRTKPYSYLLLGNLLVCFAGLLLWPFPVINIHLILLVLSLVFRFTALVLNDFYQHIRYHLSYFYPSILSILILAFVIARQEQFGDFFLELAISPLNFIAFSLIFGVSIITVWFAPSYLFFTDHFQFDQEQEKAIKERFGIWQKGFMFVLSLITYLSRLIPGLLHFIFRFIARNPIESDLMNLLWKHKNEINNPIVYQRESKGFTIVRQLLGISYIATLATLAGNVWLKSYGVEWLPMNSAILLLSLLLPLVVSYFYFYQYEKQKARDLGKLRRLLQVSWVLITLLFLVLTFTLIVLTTLNKIHYQDQRLFTTLFIFMITTLFTSLPLICYGYTFQRLYYFLASRGVSGLDALKKYARFFTAIILGANASVAGLSLFCLIFMLMVPFESVYLFISEINTINIYILLVNGLIAGITLIDRFLRVRLKILSIYHPNPNRLSSAARSWAAILIIGLPLLLLLSSRGNNYHSVPYSEEIPTSLSLTDYTGNYLANLKAETDSTQPIILIAADGGGLKAASWTMLNLHHLDSLGLYDHPVFLMAGASGGSLGQGLYTYMKAQGLSLTQIKRIIDRLSDMNFVSGDLTGVMTRWPYSIIPSIGEWPGSTQDRMEAMAETYFNTIQKEINQQVDASNSWSYSALRQQAYADLWNMRNREKTPHLPAFITNSARAEDGVKAWIHPFTENQLINAGAVDLSTFEDKSKHFKSYISFPDALFLTNRFPIMSPAAKIKGKGHFIDAGAVDNSGLETLIQFLAKMKAQAVQGDATFQEFFDLAAKRKIKVISIRHSRGRFIDELFSDTVEGALEDTNRKSELSAFFGAVVSAGIYGKPKVIDEIVAKGEAKQLFHIDTLLEVNLPFRLYPKAVENHFFRKIDSLTYEKIKTQIDSINLRIEEVHGGKRIVEPALGRLLSKPSQEYMQRMLNYPGVSQKYDNL